MNPQSLSGYAAQKKYRRDGKNPPRVDID